ncbi:unnamed protein product [Caenorhabditis angaria]|uniref:Torsin n=1 Tax=Caenorhabditis angaria TaxID=860376 RepID=A0A9P1I7Z0_9PELO|nr:unnamed protein product [Caenorhabditis angaria]
MIVRYFLFGLLLLLLNVSADPISLAVGAVASAGLGGMWIWKNTVKCKFYECCQEPDVFLKSYKLEQDIEKYLFGQHLVKDIVVNSIRAHWKNPNPTKPLVLSFHGSTGSGKNYVSEIIANNTYKYGLKSQYVKHIVATKDFPDKTRMDDYQTKLSEIIENALAKCARTLFIFDETDKLPVQLLQIIKPYLDYHASDELDSRRSIFIFLSNKGGSRIAALTLEQYESEKPREELKLEQFEKDLMDYSFNEEGGLQMSELIKRQLIDHFVPFLPLQQEHVKKCIEAYLIKRNRQDLIHNVEVITKILNGLQYYPPTSKAFSSSGCKRVDAKTDLEIERNYEIRRSTKEDL